MDQEKRTRILKTAKTRFDRFGFKKTTVDEIAQEVGISKRTLYELFASKERILAEVITLEANTFSNFCLEQINTLTDATARLETLVRMSKEYFDNNPFLGKVLSDDEGFYAPFLKGEIEFVEMGIIRMIASVLRRGAQQGAFRKMDERAAARCIFVLLRSFTYGARTQADSANQEWVPFILHAIKAT